MKHTITATRQSGMVLVVGLIMVLLMSIIAMAAIRGSGMQELMAGNMRDRNLAFQSAEAGLRDAERALNDAVILVFNGSVPGYIQAQPGSSRETFWNAYDWNSLSAVGNTVSGVVQPPRYVIEEVTYTVVAGADGGAIDFESSLKTEDATLYRITSRGQGGTADSIAILQTTYRR